MKDHHLNIGLVKIETLAFLSCPACGKEVDGDPIIPTFVRFNRICDDCDLFVVRFGNPDRVCCEFRSGKIFGGSNMGGERKRMFDREFERFLKLQAFK